MLLRNYRVFCMPFWVKTKFLKNGWRETQECVIPRCWCLMSLVAQHIYAPPILADLSKLTHFPILANFQPILCQSSLTNVRLENWHLLVGQPPQPYSEPLRRVWKDKEVSLAEVALLVGFPSGNRHFHSLERYIKPCSDSSWVLSQSQKNWEGCFWGSNFHPHPQPQNSFLRIFHLQAGLKWKFLLRRTWSGQQLLPLQFPGLSLPY